MLVTGRKSGKFRGTQAVALGVRIGREFAQRFFDKDWDFVLVEIEGETTPVKITKTFWTTCPELRSPVIGDWMRKKGLAPWPEGKPPEMRLTPMGRNRFRLEV
jgi:hypothetical protein